MRTSKNEADRLRQRATDTLAVAAVLEAHAWGETVQRTRPGIGWEICGADHDFDTDRWHYRIAPKPRQFWIVEGRVFDDAQWAHQCARECSTEIVHVREVLPESET